MNEILIFIVEVDVLEFEGFFFAGVLKYIGLSGNFFWLDEDVKFVRGFYE